MMGVPSSRPDRFTHQDELERPKVNTVQAAAIARVSRRTIYNWVQWGWVEYAHTPSGGVRIYVDTLLRKPIDADV